MIGAAPLSFDRANAEVEAEFPKHNQAALWLLAWSLPDPGIQHRDARLMAEAVSGGRPSPVSQESVARQQIRARGSECGRVVDALREP